MMNKKKTNTDEPNDNMLVQIDHKNHIDTMIEESEKQIDEFDMGNVDDIMAKYDTTEKK